MNVVDGYKQNDFSKFEFRIAISKFGTSCNDSALV